VESQNDLGIYIDRDRATVVCLDSRGKDGGVVGCFSVSVEEDEQANMQTLAGLIAQGCAERDWRFSDVSVALDCTMFMQHSVDSEFRDPRQIAATVKFDTEEALATDISSVALAFEIASSDESGSKLTVFTAQRTVLSDVLSALQQYDLDPVTIEPDINCLTRFIHKKEDSVESPQQTLFALLSRHSGYLIILPVSADEGSRKGPTVRTFLVGATEDRAKMLAREVLVTTALVQDAEPLRVLRSFDAAGVVEPPQLGAKLGMDADVLDLCRLGGVEPQSMADCNDSVGFAAAYGAALTHSEKGHKVDFRNDFSPFQGKRLRLQKSLKFAAVSVTVLLIAVGLYFQTQLFKINTGRNGLRSKFARDYADVTLERLRSDVSIKKAVRNLEALRRRVEAEKKGLVTDQKSIPANLTLVLAAFNTCAAETDLKIGALTITNENVTVAGDTSSRQSRQKLFDAVRRGGLEIVQENYTPAGGRESFLIIVEPKT